MNVASKKAEYNYYYNHHNGVHELPLVHPGDAVGLKLNCKKRWRLKEAVQ